MDTHFNEICKLDLEPIIPVENGSDEADAIAKLRYQQTKIPGAPNTIFVGSEVIAIVAEQQAWRNKFGPDIRPGYLFVRFQSNLQGQHAYKDGQLRHQFQKLVDLADLRDPTAHRFDSPRPTDSDTPRRPI